MHKLARRTRRIIHLPGRVQRTLILSALPLAAAGALIAAPAATSAWASNSQGSHAQAAISHQAKATAHTATSPAASDGSYTSCPSGDLCFWVNANWGGAMGTFAGTNPWWGDYSQSQCKGGTWNDCASALYNNGNTDNAIVYQNINYGGQDQCVVQRTTFYSDLANNYYLNGSGSKMNDSISSNGWTSHSCS